MRRSASWSFLVAVSLMAAACASRSQTTVLPVTVARARDVSPLVPADLSYARGFVQLLSDAGWSIEAVYPSKFNSFFRETRKAAFIKTDKGVVEVVFFDQDAEVEQIQVREEQSEVSGYHKYSVQTPLTKQRVEGAASYFTKHRNMFIITIDRELNDALNRLLA
jgi:hypothetical protein